MRALVITEDLVEAAWNFTAAKSAQAQACIGANSAINAEKTSKLSFHHKLVMTIWVCAAMFFCMLVLQFLLCGSELGSNPTRRIFLQNEGGINGEEMVNQSPPPSAVHGMGIVFTRGRRGMTELIVAHMNEGVTDFELRIFVRTLYRSGALARADLIILFPTNSLSRSLIHLVQDECDLGLKKLSLLSLRNVSVTNSLSIFNIAAFEEAAEDSKGRKKPDPGIGAGSIMGFEMEDLDPNNVLDSFVEDPPPQLRRWVCYQLLLGLLRHKYKTVLLARIGGVFILGDVLSSLRKTNANTNSAALLLLMESRSWDVPPAEFYHHRKTAPKSPPHPRANKSVVEVVYGADVWRSLSGEERRRKLISSGIIVGTIRAVRALSTAMVNEIIGIGIGAGHRHRHGPREPFPDQVALSYMVHVSSVLARKVTGAVQVIENGQMPTFAYSVAGTNRTLMEIVGDSEVGNAALDGLEEGRRYAAFAEIVQRDLCESAEDAVVYPDCEQPRRR